MHKIRTSTRQIAPAELPTVTPIGEATRPMNDQELLNAGIQHLSGDLYSCIEQEERDPDTLQWAPKEGQSLPGSVISEGLLQERHAKLPAEVRAKVMRASVFRHRDPTKNLRALVEAAVPNTNPAAKREAVLSEARRRAGLKTPTAQQETVAMEDVRDSDIVEADNLYPHSWAGEPKR